MERDNFNPYRLESSGESSDDEKKDDKKKAKSASGLGRLVAREEQAPKESPKTEEKDERSFLQKLAGEPAKTEIDSQQEVGEDVPLDELSAAEQVEAAQAHIDARSQELTTESAETQAPEAAAEIEADEAFLEAVQEQLTAAGDEANVDDAVEAAFAQVAAEINAESNDENAAEQEDSVSEAAMDNAVEADEPQAFDPDHTVPVVAPGGGGGGGQRNGGSVPTPAAPPPSGRPARPFGAGVAASSHNVSPDQFSSADAAYYERRGAARGLLVGGVVGYLLGRRRGRIKTEKRLKTVQEKLELQVKDVQQKIEHQEIAIRKLAREKVAAVAAVTTTAERSMSAATRTAEAVQTNERVSPSKSEQSPSQKAEATKAAVDSLSKEELLAFSAQIRVGETSLRRVYEAQLVDERGLRRLIKEYQAGHDLRRALAREFLVKELKFERDPTLRDLLPPEVQPRRQGKTEAVSNQYGDSAAAAAVNDIAAQMAAAGRSDPSVDPSTITASHSPRTGRQTSVSSSVLIGMTLLTIGLAVYAIWLTFTR